MNIDTESLKNRAAELGAGLMATGKFNDEELGAISMFRAVSELVGGIQNLDFGKPFDQLSEEAQLASKIIHSKPFSSAMSKILRKEIKI